MKRAFILGAGFSKQAGLPLATELTSLVLDGKRLGRLDDLQEWLADFTQRVAAVEGTGQGGSRSALNIEQLFDFAWFDMELHRMKEQLCGVGRHHVGASWNAAQTVKTWLGYMQEELLHVIWDAQKEGGLEPIKPYTALLSDDDTLLTFNYDTLVESALSAEGKTWNHGLNDAANGGITVLKTHGSVDWILLERRPESELKKFVKLFPKPDANVDEDGAEAPEEGTCAAELWRGKDIATCDGVMDMDKSGLSDFRYSLALAGLGRYKPLHTLPGSAQTWFTAFRALSQAEEIYVIGFSMSPYDTMAQFHFTSVLRARENPPKRVVVVDPNAVDLANRFYAVFDHPKGTVPLTLVASKAEDIKDWSEIIE